MKKTTGMLLSMLVICLFCTACSENPSETPSTIYRYPSLESLSDSVASAPPPSGLKLHDSSLPVPAKETCLAAQEKALYGMTEEDVQLLQSTIRDWHFYMEHRFVSDNIRERLANPDAPDWGMWEPSGEIQRGSFEIKEGYNTEEFSARVAEESKKPNSPYVEEWEREGIVTFTPVVYTHTGAVLVEDLQKAANGVKNSSLRADLKTIQETMQSAVEHHRIDDLDTVHQLLHDCDYWLVNYPPVNLQITPGDWEGVNVYFDSLESLKN